MSRILWLGNPPWAPSGYGVQAALFLPRFVEQGHEVAVVCNWGLHGRETTWNDIVCFPSDGQWGNVALPTVADQWRADLVIALCDAWVLRPETWPDGLEVVCWAPVDHDPIPPAVARALGHERMRPMAMSRFGYNQMLEVAGLDPYYRPHAVDTTVFCPRPAERDAIRGELDLPTDAFVVGMVAANTANRKAFPQAFLAFARFARAHDDAYLFAHTLNGPGMGGLNLDIVAAAAGIPAGRLLFPHAVAYQLGILQQAVAYTYNAFDVLLMPSMGEGFGIPLVEAQASGVPVITSRHSAMTELCGAGWLVGGDPWWNEAQSSWQITPSIDEIVEALEASYATRDDRDIRAKATAFGRAYDADTITETYWRPALAELGLDSVPNVSKLRTRAEAAA
jgi:glycosyltransferase involved in cell wall biosynthesis